MSTATLTPTLTMSSSPTWKFHLVYLIIFAILALGTREWISEHDLRVRAEDSIKASEAQVKSLQQQIADRDTAAQKAQQVIVKVVHDTTTPAQAVEAMPEVVNAPLPKPATLDATGDMVIPPPDVIPIFDQLADDKLARSQLATCTADLTDEKSIAAQQTAQIAVLKKKPSFIKRLGHDLKLVGTGAVIGGLIVLIH
jgi:hypothetical protein